MRWDDISGAAAASILGSGMVFRLHRSCWEPPSGIYIDAPYDGLVNMIVLGPDGETSEMVGDDMWVEPDTVDDWELDPCDDVPERVMRELRRLRG